MSKLLKTFLQRDKPSYKSSKNIWDFLNTDRQQNSYKIPKFWERQKQHKNSYTNSRKIRSKVFEKN